MARVQRSKGQCHSKQSKTEIQRVKEKSISSYLEELSKKKNNPSGGPQRKSKDQ